MSLKKSVANLYKHLSPRYQKLILDYPIDMKPRWGHGHPPHGALYTIIDRHRSAYSEVIDQILGYRTDIQDIKQSHTETDASRPAWNNGFLPGLDIAALFTIIASRKPNKYLEVGSGNSTKVAFLAKNLHAHGMEITSIDPHPRAEIDTLADVVVRKPFEDTKQEIATTLEANDILFIDNSHRILPNSDAMVFFMEVLPMLKKGVIVHIHDIYLPYDYPQFMCDRFYNEQYGLAMYLLANPDRFKPLFPNYFVSEDTALSAQLAPLWDHKNLAGVERHGGSFWLEIC
ncbi:MAG: class I SAM-dependent methyltransferase [Cryomorphaceae bacterium]|nr:class I SAM-dependent methyltransferase [Cryomorphaceae bacterium]